MQMNIVNRKNGYCWSKIDDHEDDKKGLRFNVLFVTTAIGVIIITFGNFSIMRSG